jgi:TolA-binding protein
VREAQASAQKTLQLAASRAAWKALEESKPAEEKAEAALKLAQSLLDAGRTEPARKRLQELIEKFPGTRAAAKAEELLKK